MNQSPERLLPGTAWMNHFSLGWRFLLVALMATLPFGAVLFSVVSGQPVTLPTIVSSTLLILLTWYLLAALLFSQKRLLGEMGTTLASLAGGDFSARMATTGNDEGRLLAEEFNDMSREVGRIISDIRDAAAELAHASVELKRRANLVTEEAARQGDSAAKTASSVEELAERIEHVAMQSHDAENNSHEVSRLSAEGKRAIGLSSGGIEALAGTVEEVSRLMDGLAQQSTQVTQITELIRDVSEQTNLLALNAAIEAARAGEHGRGFAVVADEVRQLAHRTGTSADEITRNVGSIQSEIQRAVQRMRDVSEQARLSVQHAASANEALAKIDEQASSALGSVHQIAASVQQQSSNGADIARHVEQIAEGAQQNHQASDETASVASHLAFLANGMRGALGNFRG